MAQDKRVFTGGMDKDSDPRLIKNGDYRDALNIRNISSSDSTSGSVENIEGNTIVPNQKFIDEETQVIEVTPIDNGNFEFIELESNQTFKTQKLIFSNKESAGALYSLEIAYLDSFAGDNEGTNAFISIGGTYNWTGNVDQKKTSQILYEMFGPGSPLSSFTIPDIITGNSITIQAELDFEENTALSGNSFTVTLKTTQAGSDFLIQAYGGQSGIDAGGEPFAFSGSDFSINDFEILGNDIEVYYEVSFDSVVGVDTNVDDDDVVFGGATPIPVGATEYELSIEGSQPTDNSIEPDNNVNIFSWTQVGVGNSSDDFLVETFLDLDEIKNNFGSGGDFAFDANQDSFSQAFTDAISEDKFNHVLIDGGAGSTTTVGLIKTDFLSNTKLEGLNSGGARNNPGSVAYSQLEYYYNNTEVVEGDGFSISQGTLTFSGEDVLADNSYILNSPIIRNKSYKISFTVNGLEAIGKSFTLKSGNTEIGIPVNSNGNQEFLFTPSGDSSVIYLSFDSNFSASDSFTITNLRLFLEDVSVSKLSIKLACLNTFKFNLAFATSESELRDSLSRGFFSDSLASWYDGVGLTLLKKSAGSGDVVPIPEDLYNLEVDLQTALESIENLNATISQNNTEYQNTLAELNLSLTNSQNDANGITADLNAANALNDALEANLGSIYSAYTTLNDQVNDITTENISVNPVGVTYTQTTENIIDGLNAINTAIQNLNSNDTIIDTDLNQQLESQIEANNQLLELYNNTLLELESANADVISLSNANAAFDNTIYSLNTQISELQDQISNVGLTQQELTSIIVAGIATVNNLKSEYVTQKNVYQSVLADVTLSSDVQSDISEQIDLLNTNISLIDDYLATSPEPINFLSNPNFEGSVGYTDFNSTVVNFDHPNGVEIKNETDNSSRRFKITLPDSIKNSDTPTVITYAIKAHTVGPGFRLRLKDGPSTNFDDQIIASIYNNDLYTGTFTYDPSLVEEEGFLYLIKNTGTHVVIESLELFSDTIIDVTTEDVTNLTNILSSLDNTTLSTQPLLNGLNELQSEVDSINLTITSYNTNLGSLYNNLFLLQNSVGEVITQLSIDSSISQSDIDQVSSNYNASNDDLNSQIDSLYSLVDLLNTQIGEIQSGNTGANSLNVNKWLMTLTGGVPVIVNNGFYLTSLTKKLKITNTDGWSLGGDEEVELELINVLGMTTQALRNNNDIANGAQQELSYFVRNANLLANAAYYDSLLNDPQGNFISPGAILNIPFFNEIGLATYLKIQILNPNFEEVLDENSVISNQGSVPMSEISDYVINQTGESNGLQVEFSSTVSGWEFEVVDQDENSTLLDSSQQSVTLFQDTSNSYTWNTTIGSNTPPAPGGANYKLHFENVAQIELGDGNETTEGGTSNRSLTGSVENFVSRAALPSYSMDSVKPSEALIYPSRSSDIILNKSRDRAPNLSDYNLGAKKYIKNTLLQKTIVKSNLSSKYSCIGTYEDKPKNSIYYLVHDNSSNHYDCILEYSLIDDKVRTVYQDGRVGSDGSTENILNFSNDNAITGVNKIDDILYWTDDLNRPRKINVELAKKNEVNIDNALKFEEIYYNGSSSSAFITYDDSSLKNKFRIGDVIYTQAIYEGVTSYNGYAKVTGIVRKMGSSVKFSTTNNSNQVTSSSDLSNILDPGEFIGIMYNNFPYYYQVESISGTTITTVQPVIFTVSNTSPLSLPNGNNAGALLTDCPFLESFSELPGILMFADPSDAYSPLISFGGYEDKMRYLDVIKHQPYNRPSITPETDSSYKHNNILDNLFQFKYRYVHHDNENTSYSGISDVIIDDEFARNTPLKFTEYSKTANNLKVGYVDAISDVKKIEIVARKGNDGEFFLVDTVQNNFIKYLKVLKNELIVDPEFYFDVTLSKINFKNNGVYPFVDKAESDKLFDAVPKLAKAQTIISDNRLTYGNILEGYDNTPLVMKSSFETDGKPKIETTESSLLVFATTDTSKPITTFSETNSTNAQNSNIVSGVNWDVFDNSNCQLDLFVELNGLDLNDVNSQILSLNLTFGLKRDKSGGRTLQRSGKLNMNVDITGLTTINQVRNELIGQITQGNYQGGLDADNYNADNVNDNDGTIQVTTSGATRVRIRFRFIDNDETGESNGIGTLIWGTHEGWRNVKATIDTKFLSGAPGISSFKTGAFHDFGIAYFDETNRCSFVNTSPDFGNVPLQDEFEDEEVSVNLNGTRLYNKFPTEIGPELGQSSEVKFEIYNRPPKWATSYQFVYAGNTSVDEFMQVTIPHVIPGSGGGDTQMYLSLQSLKSHKSSYTESTSSLVDFDVADGDRIRFISCKIGNERKRFTTYLDFEITGFDVYQSETTASEDTQPITTGAGEGGFYITIPNPGSQTVELDDGSTVSLNHSGFSLDGSGYDLLIAEIYRPRKTQSPENLVYNEIGDRYAIGNAGNSQRYHDGDTAQNPDYFISKEVNTEVSLVPAVIRIDSGDVYMKARTMFTIKDGSTFESFACEDYFLNDFHNTNHYDKGRINVINTNAAERRLDTSVYYSETYSSTGSINGLSSFNLANVPYFDYNKEFGSIQSLKNSDNDLIIFHESKVGRVLVKSDILNTASGTGLVSLSNEVISNYANLYSGQFGCGLNPESIVKHGKKFYFADIKRGAVLRLSADGLTVISDYGMKDYFRDIGEMYIRYNPDKIKTFEDSDINKDGSPYLLIGGYDPKYDEYVLTIPTIESPRGAYNSGNSSNANKWSESISNWDNVTSLVNLSTDETIFNAVTLAFSEGTNRWTSFYSFIPEFYSKINKQFVSFKQGRIYRHNDSDVYSRGNSEFNKFYGHNNLSYIDFVFNAEPSSVKTYNAIGLESDTKFITGMFTNMGQYYGNYDDVITTSISFKKVDGTIYLDGSNKIVGINTKFYESVSPGDLIRVFGYIKRDYLSKDFIVSKVISNNLITVNKPTEMKGKNSYMLVIDYKSKEGIQYSEVPFAGSGIDSLSDNFDFGDGSDIQGVGSASQAITNDKSPYVTLLGDNFNVVDFNKPISPVDMVSGAEYAIQELGEDSSFNVSLSSSNLYSDSNVVGTVFTSSFPQQTTGLVKVISTNYKLYYKNSSDNKTTFLGYIYSSSSTEIDFLSSPEYNNIDLTNGFLFVVKSGNIEGERMKGSYMRAILATNSHQSKSKFNLYAANADIDKSELSNR